MGGSVELTFYSNYDRFEASPEDHGPSVAKESGFKNKIIGTAEPSLIGAYMEKTELSSKEDLLQLGTAKLSVLYKLELQEELFPPIFTKYPT